MTRRTSMDPGMSGPANQGTDGLSLFDQAQRSPGFIERWSSLTEGERREQVARWKELLQPVVLRMVAERPQGITASEVQAECFKFGILNGEPTFRKNNRTVYSWIGAWLSQLSERGAIDRKMLKIEGTSRSVQDERESEGDLSNSNKNLVYVAARNAAGAAA